MPNHPFLIAAGGVLGVLLRWSIIDLVPDNTTIAIAGLNIAGSLTIGVLAGQGHERSKTWPFLAVGFCGGLTTFSTFAVDVARRLEDGSLSTSFGVFLGTTVLAIVAAGVGFRVGSKRVEEVS